MPNPIDPLAIATLGRITTNPNGIVVDGLGYYVFVEEVIVEPPIDVPQPFDPGGDGTVDFGTKQLEPTKQIKVTVCTTGSFDDRECKEYVYTESNINMSVRDVKIGEEDIRIRLYDTTMEDIDKDIVISLKEVNNDEDI